MTDNVKEVAAKNPTLKFARGRRGLQRTRTSTACSSTPRRAASSAAIWPRPCRKTGKVATWGGLNIPPVTIYMDGFWEGVQYYNQQKGKNVQVLGWNEAEPEGRHVRAARSPTRTRASRSARRSSSRAPTSSSRWQVARASARGPRHRPSGGKVNVIWVDTDGCVSASQFCQYFISSVTKNLTGAVQTYVTAAAGGTFPTGNYIGDLKNDGTGLAPFHQFDSKVPAELKTKTWTR